MINVRVDHERFWTVKLGYILIGAIAGGGGYFILGLASKYLKISDTIGKKVSGFGALACSVIAVNLASPVILEAAIQNSTKKADAKIIQAIAEAKPIGGKSASEALAENMQKRAAEELNKSEGRNKQHTAAAQFFGFYFINTRARPEYCDSLGVAIPSFVKEFDNLNKRQLIAARQILETSLNPGEERLYQNMKPSIFKTVVFGIKDQAKQYKMTERQFCEATEANAKEIARSFTFDIMLPAQSKLLLEANLHPS